MDKRLTMANGVKLFVLLDGLILAALAWLVVASDLFS